MLDVFLKLTFTYQGQKYLQTTFSFSLGKKKFFRLRYVCLLASVCAWSENPCPSQLTRKPKPYSKTVKDASGEKPLETTTPLQTQSTVWKDMSRPLYSGCKQDNSSHLKWFGIIDSALCDCKEAEQMVHHIHQDCPIWWQQRHQLWLQDESTTKREWHMTWAAPSNFWQRELRVWVWLIDRRGRRRRKLDYIRTESGWSLGSFLPAILWYAY